MNNSKLLGAILFTLFLWIPNIIHAQTSGTVRGTVIDSENGEAVFGATIVVRSEKKFAKTDFDGKYNLELPAGTYQIEYQMYGYGPQTKSVTISAGKPVQVNVLLGHRYYKPLK